MRLRSHCAFLTHVLAVIATARMDGATMIPDLGKQPALLEVTDLYRFLVKVLLARVGHLHLVIVVTDVIYLVFFIQLLNLS